MKVIISGAGQVGYGIAQHLSAEDNDVTIVDSSPELVQSISDNLDVQGIVGHGSDPDVLKSAGASDTDMLIAVTWSDEVNMVACQVAHSLFGIPTKIARVRSQSYLQPVWQDLFSRKHMPIDVVISPEVEVGDMILRRLGLPGAFEAISFLDDKIVVVGVLCQEDCPIINTPLKQLSELFPDLKAMVVGISRDGKLFVPNSLEQLDVGDRVYLAAESSQIERTLTIFGHDEKQAQRVIIAGAGNIGLYVARKLEESQHRTSVKIIDSNHDRANYVADVLDKTIVLSGDVLDAQLLREAGVHDSDTFVALTNSDQVNILASVMAKREGCTRTLSLINKSDYEDIISSLDVDALINPKSTTISHILQYVRRGRIRGVYTIHRGQGEVIEAEALDTSPLLGVTLREAKFPDGVRLGAIYRDGEIIIPNGDTRLKTHDRVVIFAMADKVKEVEHMFRVSLEYF